MSSFGAELEQYRDKVGVPAVIGAVTTAAAVVGIDVAGSRSRSHPHEAATTDDLWHLGSCGKSMTAALWARLVEAGMANWGVAVRDLFGDITDIDSGWGEPTIDDLLHCRAGVRANPNRAEMKRSHRSSEPVADQRTRAATEVLRNPPKRPGRFVYSNLGYALVGAAIDRIAGEPYEDAMATHVWAPLGITTAGTGAPPLVRGHHPRVRGGVALVGRGRPASPDGKWGADNPPLLSPAGRWHMAMADWARFVQVFLGGRPGFLSEDSLRRLLAHPEGNPDNMAMGWASGARLHVELAMQGSNTMWAATALVDRAAGRASLVVTNDGRSRVLLSQAQLAKRLLELAG